MCGRYLSVSDRQKTKEGQCASCQEHPSASGKPLNVVELRESVGNVSDGNDASASSEVDSGIHAFINELARTIRTTIRRIRVSIGV